MIKMNKIRFVFLLLFWILPFVLSAQLSSDSNQEQQALQVAKKFCHLLIQFSEGQRTTVFQQLNAMCSGIDCSAYDDLKTNKEITLRNYLMALQFKYPQTLPMRISTPTLTDCEIYQEYDFKVELDWNCMLQQNFSTSNIINLSHNQLKNCMYIFTVDQIYPTLSKQTRRKLIYSGKSGKIIAFVKQDSPIITYNKGLDAYARKKFSVALSYFDQAVALGGVKFSYKYDCYMGGYTISCLQNNLEQALCYAKKMNDIGAEFYLQGYLAMVKGQLSVAYNHYKNLEKYLQEGKKSIYTLADACYYLGILSAYPSEFVPQASGRKSVEYFVKATRSRSLIASASAYCLYQFWVVHQMDSRGGITEEDLSYSDALLYLEKAAKANFPAAYLPWGVALYYDFNDSKQAVVWLKKAAELGNRMAMAIMGRLMTTEAVLREHKTEGRHWLQQALNGDGLQESIDVFRNTIGRDIWPASRDQVVAFVRQEY